ncbi:hypothetical protein O181_039735 [Austropuccinia psidii MF-1]|uniref:GAG-pre-integrase domain-containing protein n=1 Tax=Austropuccinia psidii MF-1 TaxID=1389203 RepID=A0A9Q3HFG0_9BASI|nr:hypothetical protein [Austropuccinia psidii MF-1]
MIYAKGFGTAAITAADGSIVHMKNSLIVPSITTPLILLSPFLQKGCSLSGKGSKIQLCNENGFTILEGSILNNVIAIPWVPLVSNFSKKYINTLMIHQSVRHPSNKYASNLFPEVDFSKIKCESCIVAKSHRLPFKGSFADVFHPLEVLRMDICGPITPTCKGGNHCILQILDGSSPLAFKKASEAESNQDKSSPESPSLPSREIKKSDNNHLPKGWVMDTVPEKSPRDITSNLNSSLIIYEKR